MSSCLIPRSNRLAFACLFICMLVTPSDASEFETVIQPFFAKHCTRCHGPKKSESGVRLDKFASVIADEYAAEKWQEALDVLNGAEMPPEDEPQPSTEELAAVLAAMTDALLDARKRLVDPKSVTMRRLNKREYANTMRELLGVAVDTTRLPADGTLDGFDTIGDAQFMSIPQFETYLELARVALDRVLDVGKQPAVLTSLTETEDNANKRARDSLERTKKSIAEYEKKLAVSDISENDRKNLERQLSKQRIYMPKPMGYIAQPAASSGFILDLVNRQPFSNRSHDKVEVAVPKLQKIPRGTQFGTGRMDGLVAKLGDPIGRYTVRFRAGLTCQPEDGQKFFVDVARANTYNTGAPANYRESLGTYQITGTVEDPQVLEVHFENKGEFDDIIGIIESAANPEPPTPDRTRRGEAPEFPDTTKFPYVWIDWVEIKGPVFEQWPPPAWQAIFFKGTDIAPTEESAYAKAIIKSFADRAFRGRSIKPEFLDKLHAIFEDYRGAGSSFVDSVKEPLAVVLASPSFVYLAEQPSKTDDKRLLDDLELASRLSYFLWSYPPDAELRKVALTGKLTKPYVLKDQVERMLSDPKADQFTEAFISQWLELDWLDMIVVNEKRFPDFNETVRQSMRAEPIELFREMIRDDLSVTHFIDSDFVMVDPVLAQFYELGHAGGDGFQRVSLPNDSPRGGLLGTGSVLTMTGNGNRTSPVERGVFVYSRLLGKSVAEPPPNVPQLVVEDGSQLTVRQLLDAHTQKAQCASCHRRMDPYGFALEHFDAIGAWRDHEVRSQGTDKGKVITRLEIDSSWTSPGSDRERNGHKELKSHLMENRDSMAEGFLRSILTYALGRRVGFSDSLFVEKLQDQWKENDYGMRSLIHGIVESDEFTSK